MKRTFTIQPVIPIGYTGDLRFFNRWQKQIQKEIDKLKGTKVAEKMIV